MEDREIEVRRKQKLPQRIVSEIEWKPPAQDQGEVRSNEQGVHQLPIGADVAIDFRANANLACNTVCTSPERCRRRICAISSDITRDWDLCLGVAAVSAKCVHRSTGRH